MFGDIDIFRTILSFIGLYKDHLNTTLYRIIGVG